MDSVLLLSITFFIIAVVLISIVLYLIQKSRKKGLKRQLEELDKEKNLIASTPVLSELSKVEGIVKNEKMEERYKEWQKRFEYIKDDRLVKINDMIIDLDLFVDHKDYKNSRFKIARTELEIYKARTAANSLLDEIKEITLSEEKYRAIITKLKSKYREISSVFLNSKADYDEIAEAIVLQFENIEKRFQDFEVAMENNDYTDVVHIVKALDTMVDHMSIVVGEVPNLMLLAKQLIPKRMEEIKDVYRDMCEKGYPLDYLNLEYNLEESEKNIRTIIDRIKVLNLEECMFELKTILEYLDSLFNDFEKEKLNRKSFEDNSKALKHRLNKTNKIVSDIYRQLDDIKSMYDLTDKDVVVIDEVNQRLLEINVEYKDLTMKLHQKTLPFSMMTKELEVLSNKLKSLDEDLDSSLKSLGSMYDDEMRAREQLNEIQELLKQCKSRIRSYKLPIITNNYFVQLSEANEAILEIIKELERKPIAIRTLNTRVDTARDLVLKLYNTTNEMIKTAQLAEMAIVYGNRYRSSLDTIDSGLTYSEQLFYKGNYKGSLETAIDTINLIEPGIHKKLLSIYSKEN